MEITLDINKSGTDKKPEHAAQPCPFAAALGGFTLDQQPSGAAAFLVDGLSFGLSRALVDLTTPRLAAPPPPSQAPPFIV